MNNALAITHRTLDLLSLYLDNGVSIDFGLNEVELRYPDPSQVQALGVMATSEEAHLRRLLEEEIGAPLQGGVSHFYLGTGGSNQLRLSISALSPDLIDEGVTRLAQFIQAKLARI